MEAPMPEQQPAPPPLPEGELARILDAIVKFTARCAPAAELMGKLTAGEIAAVARHAAQLQRERDHWKANHDEMVARNAVLRDRPDLPLERVQASERMAQLQRERDEALAALRELHDTAYSRDQDDYATLAAEKQQARAEKAEAELARLQRLPEQDWASVTAVIMQDAARLARTDHGLALAIRDAVDRGKTYVNRVLSERDYAHDLLHAAKEKIAKLTAERDALARALRLERGAPAEGDLPPGWALRKVDGRVGYVHPSAEVWQALPSRQWEWGANLGHDEGDAPTAAAAIDAADAALREAAGSEGGGA
jgi:hypothetical protein